MDPSPTVLPGPRRRWRSISLRGMMLLVLVVGALMGWQARKVSLQRRAVAAVQKVGGSVVYDWQYGGHAFLTNPGTGPPGPARLRKALGDDYFQHVVQVNIPAIFQLRGYLFDGSGPLKDRAEARKAFDEKYVKPIEDDQLACLEGFDRLESLMIQQTFAFKPEGLARLGGLTRLKELHVNGQFDNNVLDRLSTLTSLEILSFPLDIERETDFAFLEKLTKLRLLNIGMGHLTDDQMKQLGRLHGLKLLTLTGTGLTDVGLGRLAGLKSLESLTIFNCPRLTGEGLASLEGLANLHTAWLSELPMDKAGLDHLAKLPNLKCLTLSKGRLDDRTLDEFKAARPGVTVMMSPSVNPGR